MNHGDSIIDIFQQYVRKHPQRIAVDFEDVALTYQQLDMLSDHVASNLLQWQVAGKTIGVAMERSPEWIISLFGILKARAVYVPLDLAHPDRRMKDIIDDCGIVYVVTHNIGNRLQGLAELLSIEALITEPVAPADVSLRPSGDDLAWLLYTSGTTGKPKGVPMRHHQAVLNARIAIDRVFHAEAGDNVAQLAGINFLVSLVETFTILLNGMTMIMIPDSIKKNPVHLIRLFQEKNVRRASIAPSLLTALPKTDIPALKTIVLIGEPISLPVRNYWMQRHQLVNCYGFTESALCVSTGIYTADTPVNDIGEITPCLEAHLLDENLHEVEPGETGELCIGGPSLTEGYWNRNDLNAEKFISNTYSAGEHHLCDVLYRSGDRMAQAPDGHMLYMGRTDDQVKIRGMRVETREVEMTIETFIGIEKCIVMAKPYQESKRLVAYLKSEGEINLARLRAFVEARLPEFMCPSIYIPIEEIPMTINRKVDKSSLPEPEWDDPYSDPIVDSLTMMKMVAEKEFLPQEDHAAVQPSQVQLPQSLKSVWADCNLSKKRNEAYKLFYVFEIDGGYTPQQIEQAWNQITEQHESLRLSFIFDGKEVVGHVNPVVHENLVCTNISDKERLRTYKAFYSQPLPYNSQILYRLRLFHLSGGRYELCLLIHHMIFDGLSYSILSNQFQQFLKASPSPSNVSSSYCDYLSWKITSENTDREAHHAFWKRYLGSHAPLQIPQYQNGQGDSSAFYELRLCNEAYQHIASYCRKESVTPFTVILAGYCVTIGTFLSASAPVISIATTDRDRPSRLNTVGYMVSILPLKMDCGNGSTVRSLIDKIVSDMANIRSHVLPIDEISQFTPKGTGLRLTDISFSMQDEMPPFTIPENWEVESPSALAVYAYWSQHHITIQFHYQQRWFSRQVIESMAKTLDTVYINMLSNPDLPLEQCPLISPLKQAELTEQFRFQTSNSQETVLSAIGQIAQKMPHRIAYRYQGHDTDYQELLDLSEKTAGQIRQASTVWRHDEEVFGIGVKLHDKGQLIPTVLAIFKLGLYYVPIEPSLPKERQDYIVKEADCRLIVTDNGIEHTIQTTVPHPTISSLQHTAYVIFTSGSTGKPKGTPISHENLMTFCQNARSVTEIDSNTRMLQFANLGFDASIYELFPVLTAGGTLVFPEEADRHNLSRLLDFIQEERISVAVIPPSLLSVLPYREIPTLKTIVLGGETTPKSIQLLWSRHYRLINGYGPTENTVMSTYQDISDELPAYNIGKALPGVSTYVVDKHMRLLPDYVQGQLFIGGRQLTAGYIARDDINKKKFTRNPFSTPENDLRGENQTIYASGDMVARTVDGDYLFLGRKDSQVKIRGHRIETEEIAHAMEREPNVHQVFITTGTIGGSKEIIAYYTEKPDTSVMPEDIRFLLQLQLPSYMIPAYIIKLDAFPLTVNNKIDEGRLPLPKYISQSTDIDLEHITSIEKMLLAYEQEHLEACKWYNGFDAGKPVVVLVCGHNTSFPFYEEYLRGLSRQFSILVFESFIFKYQRPDFQASDYLDYLLMHTENEVREKEVKIYAVTGHSIGSELGIQLAELIRQRHNPKVRMVAIDTYLTSIPATNRSVPEDFIILYRMRETMPSLIFKGQMAVALASKPSASPILNGEPDPQFLKISETIVKKNHEAWKEKYPQATKLILDTDHFGILQFKYIDDIIALF